jgi:hypothetical protein
MNRPHERRVAAPDRLDFRIENITIEMPPTFL